MTHHTIVKLPAPEHLTYFKTTKAPARKSPVPKPIFGATRTAAGRTFQLYRDALGVRFWRLA